MPVPENYLGIDFGTSTTLVSFCDVKGVPHILPINGRRYLDSTIHFNKAGTLSSVGQRRMGNQPITNGLLVSEFKLDLGKPPDKRQIWQVGEIKIDAREAAGIILNYVHNAVKKSSLGEQTEVVLTVPAMWDADQCADTELAAKAAGFRQVYFVDEPTSALLCYNLSFARTDINRKILVFDFGGGTLDVSIINTMQADNRGTKYSLAEPLSVAGRKLGGKDIDECIASWLADEFERKYGIRIDPDKPGMQNAWLYLKNRAEYAKRELVEKWDAVGDKAETEIIELYLLDEKGLDVTLSYQQFSTLIRPVLDRILAPVEEALTKAQLSKDQVDEVILAGGSSHIPQVRQILEDYFGKNCHLAPDPMEVVALGAAIRHYMLKHRIESGPEEIRSVLNDSYGLVIVNSRNQLDIDVIAKAGTRLPISSRKRYRTAQYGDYILLECVVIPYEEHISSPSYDRCKPLQTKRISFHTALPANTEMEIELYIDTNKTIILEPYININGRMVKLENYRVEGAKASEYDVQRVAEKINSINIKE